MMKKSLSVAALTVLLTATAAAQSGTENSDLVAEARRTVMIPHSKDAKTAELKLSADATRLVDAYLDYCRNRWQRRCQASSHLHGSPHAVWERDGDRAVYSVRHAKLHIVDASVPVSEAPAVVRACRSPGFRDAVRVENDVDALLDLWGIAFSGQFAEQVEAAVRAGARGLDQEAWRGACAEAAAPLVEGWAETPPMEEIYPRGIHLAGSRKVYLDAIRVLTQERSGAILARIHGQLAQGDNEFDKKTAALALAAAQGGEADAYVLAELASGDSARQRAVLRSIGPHVGPEVLAATKTALEKAGKDPALAMIAVGALRRTAAPGSPRAAAARSILLSYAQGLAARSPQRLGAVLALAATAGGDEKVLAFLGEELARARATYEKASPARRKRMEAYIQRLEAALGK